MLYVYDAWLFQVTPSTVESVLREYIDLDAHLADDDDSDDD